MAIIVFKEPSVKKRSVEIEGNIVSIGRGKGSTLHIEDKSVSWEHCIITKKNERYFIKDLLSTNGTFVNGKKISGEVVLNPKDIIRIGKVKFTFEETPALSKSISVLPSKSAPKIIVRTVSGKTIKGYTANFDRNRDYFYIMPVGKAYADIATKIFLRDLKAVFFVRAFKGKATGKGLPPLGEDKRAVMEKAVEVEFADGEVVVGKTLTYQRDEKGQGFFIIPLDPRDNNERIFVVNSSVKRITPLEDSKNRSTRSGQAKKADKGGISGLTKDAENYIKQLEGRMQVMNPLTEKKTKGAEDKVKKKRAPKAKRCAAKTKAGKSCKRPASGQSEFCNAHKK